MKQSLSVCLMVKNEEAVLERCLASVKGYVDQICVLDTGSTDATIEIARRYADVVTERPWPKSFAKARQWSLHRARSRFVFVLDADEYIADPAVMWPNLYRRLTPHTGGLVVRCNNIVGEIEDRFWQPRVFRRGCVHYRGRIHHQPVLDQGWVYNKVPAADFEITHTGYDLEPEAARRKYSGRLAMLALLCDEANNAREKAYAIYQYGVGQYLAGEYAACTATFARVDETHLARGTGASYDERLHMRTVWVKAYLSMARDGMAVDHRAAAEVASRLALMEGAEPLLLAGQLALVVGQVDAGYALFVKATEATATDRSLPKAYVLQKLQELDDALSPV